MKKVFKLGYIHCAGCSVALQDKISKVENVKNAQINFVTKIVTIEIENKNAKETMKKVEEAIHEFDKSIEILPANASETKDNSKAKYYFLGASVLLWAVAISLQRLLGIWYIHFPIYLCSLILVGFNVFLSAFKNIIKGKVLDETFLMSIATIGAFIIGEYLEGCAVMIFYTIGEIFQHYASTKSETSIKSLATLKSEFANVINENGEVSAIGVDKIKIGDKISVSAGEKVPLDGKIVGGGANFNTSAITGESAGQYLTINSDVISGYIAEDGQVIISVTSTSENSTISKIVEMVEEASASKANAEKFIAKFARIYTPIVVGLALIICFVMPAFWGYTIEVFKVWAYKGLSFLVVSCPCALVLSVPLAYFTGIGACAKSGVLVRGANYLEILSKTKSVCFDKTGTLTTGNFEVVDVVSAGEKDSQDILELVAYAESFSSHRIAKSIVKHYEMVTGKTINTAWVNGYREVAGGGIVANIFMEDCVIGNALFMKNNNVIVPDIESADTIVYLAVGGNFAGYVCVSDTIKIDAKETIADLKKMGIKTCMFTGDKNIVAQKVIAQLDVDFGFGELLPADKVEKVREIKESGTVAFVGDGINDAPALGMADVGIAMGGSGTDIAIESADLVVLTDEPQKVVESIKIAKNSQGIVLENVIFTIGFKIATMILVSVGLAGMWLAVFADVGVSVLAVLNSLRAMKRFQKNKKLK